MKNYKKHIDAFIKEKAGRNGETPPAHVWDNINKQLDGLIPSKKPPVSFRWLRYFAIASLVLLIGVPVIKKLSANATSGVKDIHSGKIAAAGPLNGTTGTGNTKAAQNGMKTDSQSPQADAAQRNIGNNTNSDETTADNKTNEDKLSASTKTATNAGAINKQTKQTNLPPKADEKGREEKYADNGKQRGANSRPRRKHNKQIATTDANNHDNKNKADAPATTVQPTNNYGSNYTSANNNAVSPDNTANLTRPDNETTSINKQTQPSAGTTKRADTAQKVAVKRSVKKEHKHMSKPAKRLEEGIKAGYENGFSSSAASKYVLSPYIQYNVSAKVSLLMQPTVKYAQLPTKNVGTPQSYYNINAGEQTYDSIVKSYVVRGSYLECELPILLKYYLSKKISVFGGINLLYSRQNSITENTYTKSGIPELPTALDVSYTGLPYSIYTGPLYQSSQTGVFHVGYMIGFSYEYNKRWLLDGLMEQSPVSPNVIGGNNMNAPLSAYYLRLSVGYRLQKTLHPFRNGWGKTDYGRGD